MLIKVNVPLAQGVGVVELSTETTEDVITIRIGDATATVKRIDLVDSVCTRLSPALVPYEPNPYPEPFGGGMVRARVPR